MMRSASLILLGLFLSGCDVFYGVSRGADLDRFVDYRCVEAGMEQVGDISSVRHEYSEGARPLTITGIKRPNQLHYFFYETKGLGGYVLVSITYDNRTHFGQSYGAINVVPRQTFIDDIRPVMVEIEKAVERSCGIAGFSTQIVEYCRGVRCDQLP